MKSSNTHVRPKVRSKAKKAIANKPAAAAVKDDDIDALLEETRGRLDSLLTVAPSNTTAKQDATVVAAAAATDKVPVHPKKHDSNKEVAVNHNKPTGILKKPKYTNNNNNNSSSSQPTKPKAKEVSSTSEPMLIDDPMDETMTIKPDQPAVRRLVVERDPLHVKPEILPGMADHRAVEGYTPMMEDDGDVVLSSFADLMDKAGMPPQNDPNGAKIVEANLEFSVMSKQEFEEEEEQQQDDDDGEEQLEQDPEVFQGRFDVFSDDEEDDDSISFFRPDPEDDDYYSDEQDDDVIPMPPPEPRAFMKLWDALSSWITPEAVTLVKTWEENRALEISPHDWAPIVDRSEIAAARCTGVMAMINMNLQRCLNDLEQPVDADRIAKHRLADLLRTFDYSRATAKLDTRLWRAMTCVLLDMVLVLQHHNNDNDHEAASTTRDPPASARAVGIKPEEYTYLTQASFKSLAAGM